MNIIINVEEFDPEKGYLEYYLARELVKLGNKVYIFTFTIQKRILRKMLKDGFEVIYLPHFISIKGYNIPNLKGINFIINFLKKENPSIIHCQPLDSPLSLIFIYLRTLFRYKVVGSIFTQLDLLFTPWNLQKKILFSLSKIVISQYVKKRTEIFFAKTNELALILSRSYKLSKDRFCIIPLGADPELFKFNSEARTHIRKKLALSENDFVIVYSGKINQSKCLDVLLKALKPIIKINKNIKILLIGKSDSIYYIELIKLISGLKMENNVIFYPWVNRSSLSSFYSASEIGVWPGLSSISIVEAASTGLPLIIASYPIEIYAIENKNGFSFKIGNTTDLHKYIKLLINDESLRKEMGLRSRTLIVNKLNWSSISMLYFKVYTSILKSSYH